MSATRNIIMIVICAFVLSACGQKGPLYFPKPKEAPKEQPAT